MMLAPPRAGAARLQAAALVLRSCLVVCLANGEETGEWLVSTLAGAGPKDLDSIRACRIPGHREQRTDGPTGSARFAAPTRVQIINGTAYVLDGMNGCIRAIKDGAVSSITPCCTDDIGTGSGHGQLDRGSGAGPQDMHLTSEHIYMLDSYNNQLKRSSRPFERWIVLAGNGSRPDAGRSTDGPALAQALNEPHGMAVAEDGSGDVYIAETWSSCIRLLRNGSLTTIAGTCGIGGHADGDPFTSRFQHPHHINLDPRNESRLYVSDVECWDDDRWPDDSKHRPCSRTAGGVCFSGVRLIELDRSTGHATKRKSHSYRERECNAWVDGNRSVARFNYIHGTAFQALSTGADQSCGYSARAGGSRYIYVCDEDNSRIRRIDLETFETLTLAGSGKAGVKDGLGASAEFKFPGGLGVDEHGVIYVGDYEGNRVRKVAPPIQQHCGSGGGNSTPPAPPFVFLKGSFHQHATQPLHKCHHAAGGVDGSGTGEDLHKQDDGGTDADVLLAAIEEAGLGYDFVGLIGNEELPMQPIQQHTLTWLQVMENQMAKICTKGDRHCPDPCDPVVPPGSGPWKPTVPPVNNLHREYIQGVPGVWVQHPTTDPERAQMLAYMKSGQDNVRGMEVYNAWADQAWDAVIPRADEDIDPLYPTYMSINCTAWDPYQSNPSRYPEGACTRFWGMSYWDATLRHLKRPVYGLADDDGFVYTGSTDEPVYKHGRHDVQANSPAWFRFGIGYSMVQLPGHIGRSANRSEIATAIDRGQFYATTGIDLIGPLPDSVDSSGSTKQRGNATARASMTSMQRESDLYTVVVEATEAVVFGVTGGSGTAAYKTRGGTPEEPPLTAFNLSLCRASENVSIVTNVGCAAEGHIGRRSLPPPHARTLRLDLRQLAIERGFVAPSPLDMVQQVLFVRIQCFVRTRYPILAVEQTSAHDWHVIVGPPLTNDGRSDPPIRVENHKCSPECLARNFQPGKLLHATGGSRRPLMVQSAEPIHGGNATRVKLVAHFSEGDGDITPDLTTLEGITPNVDQLVSERWAWLQPLFRTPALHERVPQQTLRLTNPF